jgi:hypothetical protein
VRHLSRGPVKGKGTVIVILGLLKFSEGALWAPSDFYSHSEQINLHLFNFFGQKKTAAFRMQF